MEVCDFLSPESIFKRDYSRFVPSLFLSAIRWWCRRRVWSKQRKPAPVALCPSEIPHDLIRARSRSTAVRSRRLIAWAAAWRQGVAYCLQLRWRSQIKREAINVIITSSPSRVQIWGTKLAVPVHVDDVTETFLPDSQEGGALPESCRPLVAKLATELSACVPVCMVWLDLQLTTY
jgi:hypothetical protein